MKKICLFLLGSLMAAQVLAQKHDYNYIITSSPDPYRYGIQIQYSDSSEDIQIDTFNIIGRVLSSPIFSNKEGSLLMYSNNLQVYDSLGRVAINGDSMAVGYHMNFLYDNRSPDIGFGIGQNAAFIPITDSLFYLFHAAYEGRSSAPTWAVDIEENGLAMNSYVSGLWLTKLRLQDDGRIKVMENEKKIQLLDTVLGVNQMTFIKQKSDKDWWILLPEVLSDSIHVFELNTFNEELSYVGKRYFSPDNGRVCGTPYTCVSPNGDKVVRFYNQGNPLLTHKLEIFDFDRCTGESTRILFDSFPVAEIASPSGDVEFSDNGRFLYIAMSEYILQLDMEDPEPTKTWDTIAVLDDFRQGSIRPVLDDMWKLPNGKILICGLSSTSYMHYIHNPNEKGDACNFEQRALIMPPDPLAPDRLNLIITSLPSYPPYRMLALETPCEVNNIETFSQTVFVSLYPNPAVKEVSIQVQGARIKRTTIFDIVGNPLKDSINGRFSLTDLSRGVYFVQVETDNGVYTRKLIVE